MNKRNKPRFALTGLAGYIAPRHLKAIKECGGELVAACDPNDSVGIVDSFFPNTRFFKEFERFDRYLEKSRRKGEGIDYISICSPNYLHDAHIRAALRLGAHAICEKPLVLNPWNIDPLTELAQEHGKEIYTILQLRLHPAIKELKRRFKKPPKTKLDIDLKYVTPRGKWYLDSWKGNLPQSGGLATNIGIHFFDMLIWIFGSVKKIELAIIEPTKVGGSLQLEGANVNWFLSIDDTDVPARIKKAGGKTFRSLTLDGKEVEFSAGFTDLHTEMYKCILKGNGFGPEDVRESIQLAHDIRNWGSK